MRGRFWHVVSLAVAVGLVVGCASSPLDRAKALALTLREVAEGAYTTVCVEHELGRVDDETMARARALYERWAAAQNDLVDALEEWEETGAPPRRLPLLREAAREAAIELRALAERALRSRTRPARRSE